MYNVHVPWLLYYVLLHDYEYVIAPGRIIYVPDYMCQSKKIRWCYYMTKGAREDYLLIKVIENGKIFNENHFRN